MASLFKRGKKYWISFRLNGKLVQRSLKTDNHRVARERVRQIEYELSCGDLYQISRTPVPEFLEEFCGHLRATRTAKSCYNVFNRLRSVFGPVCPSLRARQPGSPARRLYRVREHDKFAGRHLHARLLEDVTPTAINCWLDARTKEEHWQPKTVNNYRQTLHKMFSYAIRHRRFCSRDRRYPNPAAAVERRREPAPEILFLMLDQIDEQLEALATHPTLQAMAAVYIYAGLRREEAVWLTRADVDLDSRLIRLRAKTIDGEFWQPKTKRNRVVPVSDALSEVLTAYRRPVPESLWYFTSPKGLRWGPDNFSRDLRNVNLQHGLTWNCLHFRHTFGSQLAQKGESLFKISALMGNSPEICRRHYAALIPEEMSGVVEFRQKEVSDPGDDDTKTMLREILRELQGEQDLGGDVPCLRLVRPSGRRA